MTAPPAPPRVSVALCTYNGERFIRRQLESILSQSQPVSEVVIGDDGSTDRTLEIVRAVVAETGTEATVRVEFTERVGGVVPNFERTLRACTSELVALSDQDDVWRVDRIRLGIERFAERPELVLLASDAALIDAQGVASGATLWGHLYVSDQELAHIRDGEGFAVLMRRNLVTGATVMLRRDLLADALPFPSSWIHDEWLAALAAARRGMDFMPEPLIDYRVHTGNQIGVAKPTLQRRVGQVFAARADRLVRLSSRADHLVERLESLGAEPKVLEVARAKQSFERSRAAYPSSRLRRVRLVLTNAAHGSYARLASQGNLDVFRDLLQPASRR